MMLLFICFTFKSPTIHTHTCREAEFSDVSPAGTSRHNDLYWSCSDLAGVAGLRKCSTVSDEESPGTKTYI